MKAEISIPISAILGVVLYMLLMSYVVMLALGALHASIPGVPAFGFIPTLAVVTAFRMLLISVQGD